MLFRKSGCLVVTENVFNIDCKIRATGRKIFSVVIFTSNHFRRRAKRERGRERRTHRRTNREREREREIAPSNPRSRRSDRCRRRLHATVSALFIQASPRSHTSTPTPARSIHIQELWSLLHELRSTWDPIHMTHPYSISLFLDLPLPFPHLSITLFSSFSPFDRDFGVNKCFVLIFVWFCFDFCLF